MPILLNDLTNSNNMPKLKAYSPKFFDSKLTGAGKNTGLLKETVNPRWPNNDRPIMSENVRVHKRTSTNGSVTTTYIPVNPIDASAWEYMKVIPQPDLTTLTKIGVDNDYELYIDMKPHSVMLEETSVSNSQPSSQANGKTSGITRGLTVCYQLLFYNVYKKSNAPHKNVPFGHHAFFKQAENTYQTTMTCSPYADIRKIVADLTSHYTINPMDVTDWLDDYELYVGLCERSQQWQTTIDKDLDVLFENIENYSKTSGLLSSTVEGIVSNVLRKLEDYSVPLDLYKNLYKSVTKHFPNIAHELCKQNLNLLLSDTLNNLHLNKPSLTRIPAQNSNMTMPTSVSRLSPEQYAAVSSTDSLILVQSGAGTGKALDLDTPVLTPTGWTLMRDIQIGDKVIGSDGKPHTVTGVWDHPDKNAYNLTFRDGSSVIACDEHLWQTYHVVKGETKQRTKAITTQEWIDNRKYKDYDFLPQVSPVEYEFGEKDLPLDPYFLGALLADGALGLNSVQYTKSEMPVVEEVRKHALMSGFEMYDATCETSTANQWRFRHAKDTKGYSVLKDKLRDMDLLVKSHEKFIPDEYKTASVAQRKALLNGLFDGDGDIRTGRTYARYNTASDQMADDVLQILWSLGLSATKQRQTHSKGDYWSINLLDQSWDPFVASHCKGQHKGSVRPMRRSLVNAEYLGTRPMKCITVDAPDHLYVAKDFIVTHNSTTILSRIDYMVAVGVKPEDITVLSFTNAAADHIKERNPSVHSMTIARMIHTIYEKNFPTHELSSLDTIINSLDIYFPGDPDARQFAHYCKLLLKNDNNAFTAMNSYIEQNFDKVVKMLDRLKQTALELEIIICYQKIDTLQEPPEVQSKFLIIDEVQDNSIFEFVYTLKYVDKHKESLFIVGDCSQTLFEFRASNPRAINVLEGSGVFTTFKLQVNYRSNQEVLDFANVLLRNIEANQYANIQLRANSLAPVTLQSFKEKVNFKYYSLSKIRDFDEALSTIFVNTLKPYIDDKLAKHEQIAFLAFSRRHVALMEDQLRKMYPNNTIANLMPARKKNSTVFSEFIRRYWSEVKFSPSSSICAVIANTLMSKLTYMTYGRPDKLQPIVRDSLAAWRKDQQSTIDMWQRQYQNGQISFNDFMTFTKESMLSYEIRVNAMKQALLSAQNEAAKNDRANQTADIVLSTIHSAKGLEFPHVVLICRAENNMDEENKRMYYVALTRAMKSEYVVAYETVKSPQMEADYNQIISILTKKAALQGPTAPTPAPNQD